MLKYPLQNQITAEAEASLLSACLLQPLPYLCFRLLKQLQKPAPGSLDPHLYPISYLLCTLLVWIITRPHMPLKLLSAKVTGKPYPEDSKVAMCLSVSLGGFLQSPAEVASSGCLPGVCRDTSSPSSLLLPPLAPRPTRGRPGLACSS